LIDVGGLDELPEHSVRIVKVGRREIGVVRWEGDQVYAVHNRCPHQGGPVCLGGVAPRLEPTGHGALGTVRVEHTRPVLICPWHHWEFDLASGDALYAAPNRLRTYPARVKDGRILIDPAGH
jgi:nitrite reductase (NADH) small subunit